jgi:chromosome segregation ATPase
MEGTSGSSQACLEEAGDMNDKPSPIAGSAPEERQSRFRQRRATGKALVVERVGRASKGREEAAPVVPPEQQQSSDRLGGDTRSLTEPEQRARLSALADAQRRGPDERRLAEERSYREAIQELKGKIARLESQLAVTLAEKEAERLRVAELARGSDALRHRSDALGRDIDRLGAALREAEDTAREREGALLAERTRSEKLSLDLDAARDRAADATAEREELTRKLAKAERELASYWAQPWWRRLIG